MNPIRYTLLCLLALWVGNYTMAQQNQPMVQQPVPPSPNAASLGKYGEVPVSKYTGIPEISVPIWDVKDGDINVPISLSYHGGGIKVEENASWVGLGWSLNAGGVITRSVRGRPDENGYLATSATNAYGANNLIPDLLKDLSGLAPTKSSNDFVKAASYAGSVINEGYDSEPDLYFFNFNGYSGKFVLDQNGAAYTIPYQKIKIERASYGWQITTPDGTIFKFGDNAKEQTLVTSMAYGYYGGPEKDNSETAQPLYTSAWYMSAIQSPTGHNVSFSYTPEYYQILPGLSQYLAWDLSSQQNFNATNFVQTTGSRMDISGVRLSSITFSNGHLDFVSTGAREDVGYHSGFGNTSGALQKITVSNSTGAIRNFVLGTDYFTTSDQIQNESTKRLRLNSITEWSGDMSTGKPPYIFSYDNTGTLPAKSSTSQDHWGYYNGKTNKDANGNPTLIPDTRQQVLNVSAANYQPGFGPNPMSNYYYNNGILQISYSGADRSPDFIFGKIGTLSKITYPTGGYVTFEYEPHDYDLKPGNYQNNIYNGTLGGLRIKKISVYSNLSAPIIKNYSYRLSSNPLVSSGVVVDLPLYTDEGQLTTFNFLMASLVSTTTGKTLTLTSGSKFELGQTNGAYVGYREVKESFCGDNSCSTAPLGFKINKFTSTDDYLDVNTNDYGYIYFGQINNGTTNWVTNVNWLDPASINPIENKYPYPPKNSYDWKRGLPVSEELYDNGGALRRKTEISYNLVTDPSNSKILSGLKIVTNPMAGPYEMHLARYDVIAAWNYKTQDKTTEIDLNNNQIVSTTNYFYDNPANPFLTRSETTNSKDENIRTSFLYPADFPSDPVSNTMVGRFQLAPVIEKTEVNLGVGNGELGRLRTNYGQFQGNIILPYTIQRSFGGNALETDATVDLYDLKGNILQATGRDGIVTSYLWGYNGEYPVAKIVGGSYGTASGIASNQTILDNPTDDQTLRDYLNNVRTGISTAMVTTYTYKPLVGMTSQTDSRGFTNTYSYDALGRLQVVRDQDGNVVKKICYNYAGQAEDCSTYSPVTVPATIYVRRTNENIAYFYGYPYSGTTADVMVRFYSDAACTQPVNIGNLSINVSRQTTGNCGFTTNNYSLSVNGTSYMLYSGAIVSYNADDECDFFYDLVPGTGYIIVN